MDQPPATNNDGRVIYKDKENEVLVYGTYTPSTFSTQDEEVNRHIVMLDNGEQATGMRSYDENDKMQYIVFVTKDDIQYVFFASVSKEFYSRNAKVLEEVAKGLNF